MMSPTPPISAPGTSGRNPTRTFGSTCDVQRKNPKLSAKATTIASGPVNAGSNTCRHHDRGAAGEEYGRPGEPTEPDRLVLQAAIGHLPRGVVRGPQRAGEAEPGPQETDDADDRRRSPAARGPIERGLELIGGVTGEAEIVDEPLREIGRVRL